MLKTKNITLSLPYNICETINKDYGSMGNTESEIIQNIVISFLSVKNFFINCNKTDNHTIIYDNIEVLNHMMSSTIELLVEKNIISENEWKKRMQRKIMR